MCCDILKQHIVITVGGSLIPLFYYLYTQYSFRAFFKWDSSKTSCDVNSEKQLFLSSNKIFPTPEDSAWCFLLPKHRWIFREYKRISLIQRPWWIEVFFCFCFKVYVCCCCCCFLGEVSLVESNGLVGTQVSVESRNLGPQSLHWPECLSGPPQTASDAGRRLNRDRGSSCFAFSSFCGSWDPLPLGVSEIAAGSERETRLKTESTGVRTPAHTCTLKWIVNEWIISFL